MSTVKACDQAADQHAQRAEFETFYLRTARTLHGYLCRISRDAATAEEILHDAYIRLIHAPPVDEKTRKAYLYTTATNLLRDRWRRQKRLQEWSESNPPTAARTQNFHLPLDMASILDLLSAQERAMLWLAHVEELTHREISSILGVKEKSVRVILYRAREKAKGLLVDAGFRGSHE